MSKEFHLWREVSGTMMVCTKCGCPMIQGGSSARPGLPSLFGVWQPKKRTWSYPKWRGEPWCLPSRRGRSLRF